MNKYKTIGPHVVVIPKGIEIKVEPNAGNADALIPIADVLNTEVKNGWELVTIIENFPIAIPQRVAMVGKPPFVNLHGVCALMKKG